MILVSDIVEALLGGNADADTQREAAMLIEKLAESEARAWRDYVDARARMGEAP